MQNDSVVSEISFLDYWRALLDEWRLIFLLTTVFAGASVVMALVLTPIYRAEVTVVEVDGSRGGISTAAMLGQLGNLAGLAGVDLARISGDQGSARAILNSRKLVEDFITEYDLVTELFPDSEPTLWEAVRYFREEVLSINEEITTGNIYVTIDWKDPEQAATWANAFVEYTNDMIRSRELRDAERNMSYLREQLDETGFVELERVIYNLIESELQTMMLANARKQYAFTIVDPAVIPERREFPRRTLIVVLGTALGGFFALVVVLIRLINRTASANSPGRPTA